nr:hypothetical protein [Streptomyces sp. SP17BM10]
MPVITPDGPAVLVGANSD